MQRGFEQFNGNNGLDRRGVNTQAAERRQMLRSSMGEGNPAFQIIRTVNMGPRAIAEAAKVTMRANLIGLQEVVNQSKALAEDPASGLEALSNRTLGSGKAKIAKLMEALTADVPTEPGEKPSAAARMLLSYRQVRARNKNDPPIDKYNVRTHDIEMARQDIALLQSLPPEEEAARQSLLQQLDLYARQDPQQYYVTTATERMKERGMAKGTRMMGKLGGTLVGGLYSLVATGMALRSGNANPTLLLGPALSLYSLYPDLLRGKLYQQAMQSNGVVHSPMYRRLAPPLGAQTMEVLLTNIPTSRKACDTFLKAVRESKRNPNVPLDPKAVDALVEDLLPADAAGEKERAILKQNIVTDPNGMQRLIERMRKVRNPQAKELVSDYTKSSAFLAEAEPPAAELALAPVNPLEGTTSDINSGNISLSS